MDKKSGEGEGPKHTPDPSPRIETSAPPRLLHGEDRPVRVDTSAEVPPTETPPPWGEDEIWQDWDSLEEEAAGDTAPGSAGARARPGHPAAAGSALLRVLPAGEGAGPRVFAPPDKDSLHQWIALYYSVHVVGAPARTEQAKRRDLETFVGFFDRALGHDRLDGWTPAVTRHFQSELRGTLSFQSGRPFKSTTVNRVIATVRHFGRWVHKQRPLLAGNPFEGVKDLVVDPPAWNGLTPREVLRLRAASEQRQKACTRKDQDPLLETAVFLVLLHTGLRESELVSLDLAQYHHRGFHQVPRKGKRVSEKVPVPGEAREALDVYIEKSRGGEQGPLFLGRRGNPLAAQDVARICARICRQANAHVPEAERIHLTPHMLRHTFLKRVADKHGVHVAQRMSGNVSIREIFRYTKPSEEEMQRTAEELFA